tara:strand:- start:73 stop:495 length:423 start_codon:yes stop_codon:yes gene_type:complete
MSIEKGRIKCRYDLNAEHPILRVHFPGNPVMPGVLYIEHIAQAGGICLYMNHYHPDGSPLTGGYARDSYIAKTHDFNFKHMSKPPHSLETEVKVEKLPLANFFLCKGKVFCSGKLAAAGSLTVYFDVTSPLDKSTWRSVA